MIEYKGYLADVQFDDEANIFHGEVINIRDVITFQDQTVHELRNAFSDSVEDYLEFCAERGEAPNKPFSGHLIVSLSPQQQGAIPKNGTSRPSICLGLKPKAKSYIF